MVLDFMMQRYRGDYDRLMAMPDRVYQELATVWRAEAEAVRLRTPGPDGKPPPREPGPNMDLRTLAQMEGFMVPPAPTETDGR